MPQRNEKEKVENYSCRLCFKVVFFPSRFFSAIEAEKHTQLGCKGAEKFRFSFSRSFFRLCCLPKPKWMKRVGSFFLLLEKTWKCCYSKYFFLFRAKSRKCGRWNQMREDFGMKFVGFCVCTLLHISQIYVFFLSCCFLLFNGDKNCKSLWKWIFYGVSCVALRMFHMLLGSFSYIFYFSHTNLIFFPLFMYFFVERVERITLEVSRDSSQPKHSVE